MKCSIRAGTANLCRGLEIVDAGNTIPVEMISK